MGLAVSLGHCFIICKMQLIFPHLEESRATWRFGCTRTHILGAQWIFVVIIINVTNQWYLICGATVFMHSLRSYFCRSLLAYI